MSELDSIRLAVATSTYTAYLVAQLVFKRFVIRLVIIASFPGFPASFSGHMKWSAVPIVHNTVGCYVCFWIFITIATAYTESMCD